MTLVNDGTPFANHGTLIVTTQGNDLAHDWRNTMELAWTAGSTPIYSDAVVTAFVNFLKGAQRDDCSIVKVALMPYVKGRQPLSAQGAIWEQTVSIACKNWGSGTVYPIATTSGPVPLGEVCVMLTKGKFSGGGGRVGRMFVRNAINDDLVLAQAGGPPIVDPTHAAEVATDWNNWCGSQLATYCEDNPLPRFVLIHAQKLTQTPPAHDIFDTAMAIPTFSRLTMHDLTSKNKR